MRHHHHKDFGEDCWGFEKPIQDQHLSLLANCGFKENFAKAVKKKKACNVVDYFIEITHIPSYADMRSDLR